MRSSQKKLGNKEEQKIKLVLSTLLADIKDPKEMSEFLKSFLTDTEFLGLSKRLSIIKLLAKGDSYELIQESLNVSSATISSTADFKNDRILAKILQKLEVDEWAGKIAKKIFKIFSFKKPS